MPSNIDPNKVVWDAPIDASAVKWDTPSLASGKGNPSHDPTMVENAISFIKSIPDSALKALPPTLATVGGLIGTPARVVGPAGNIVPVALAAAGGGTGQAIENIARRATGLNYDPNAPSAYKTAAEMGMWEAGAGPLLNIISKIAGPAAAKFAANPEAQSLKTFTEKYNLPMSASTIQPSKAASVAEGVTKMIPSGQWKMGKYQDDLYQKMLNLRGNVLGELTGKEAELAGAPSFAEGVRTTKAGLRMAEKTAYADIVPEIGGRTARIPMSNTRQLVDDILESARVQRNPEMAKLLDKFNSESAAGLPAKSFYDLQAKVNSTAAKNKDYELASDIWNAMNTDIKAFDQTNGKKLMDIVQRSKGAHQEFSRFDKVASIFQKSSAVKDGTEMFYPDKFYGLVMNDANQKYFAKEFGQDALDNLKTYAEHMRKISMELKKRQLSETDKLWKQTGVGAKLAGTAGLYYGAGGGPAGAAAVAVPYGMSYAMAVSIMKPKGAFKKWLTEGFNVGEGTKEALKVGGRTAIAND